jgi:hypothetical protein
MTTAQLRQAAQEAAEGLRWAEAASLMRRAIDGHPGNPGSALVQRDLARMEQLAASYEESAK